MATIKDLSALVARYEAKIDAKPEKEAALQAKLNAKIASAIAKGKTVTIDGATVTSYTLGEDNGSGGGGGGTTGSSFTLTSDTQSQNFSTNSGPITVTVDGDDDAVDGDEFSVTMTAKDDTLIAKSYKFLIVDAGAGVDTLDLSDTNPGNTVGGVNLATGVTDNELNAVFINFENVIASDDGGRIVGSSGDNVIYMGDGDDEVSGGAGNDTIVMEDWGTNDSATGGTGTDVLRILGEDSPDLTTSSFGTISGVETIEVKEVGGDDITLALGNRFDSATTTVAITNGITKVSLDGGSDDVVEIARAANNINLIGVTFSGVEKLDITAAQAFYVDKNTLNGLDELEVSATGAVMTLSGGGEFNLSDITLTTLSDITGSSSNDTINFGRDLYDIDTVDMGAGAADTITFAGTLAGDISAVTSLSNAEVLTFGSAASVTLDDGHGAVFTTITGSSIESDTLSFQGTSVDLTGVTMSAVNTIALDGTGAAVTITAGTNSLAGVKELIGDSGTDILTFGGAVTGLDNLTITSIERMDLNGKSISMSTSTYNGIKNVYSGAAGGKLTFTDSGTVTLGGTNAATAQVTFFSGDDVITLGSITDAGGAYTLLTGAGNDLVTGSTSAVLTASTIELGAGDDTFVNRDTLFSDGRIATLAGGEGTDTLSVIGDATITAGEIAASAYTGFEILSFGQATTSALTMTLGATDIAVSTVTMAADTSSAGANVLNASAGATKLTIIGSAGADTITTTRLGDTVDAGAGNDTINVLANSDLNDVLAQKTTTTVTLGAGTDTVKLDTLAALIGDSTTDIVVVTDFGATDVIDLTSVTATATEYRQSITQAVVDAARPSSLTAAMTAINAHYNVATAGSDVVTAFQFNGDTYVYFSNGDATTYSVTNDAYVKLTGLVSIDMTVNVTSD